MYERDKKDEATHNECALVLEAKYEFIELKYFHECAAVAAAAVFHSRQHQRHQPKQQ